ncbi:MAG: alpha/beta hydrolase [Alphaproteobacteria bacterium]|jgi:pimeloyl-ACP methyl ester carboxylesterase|nr:alpha/beta hydrolase [Alphaproteobacteria bacterium]MDP6567104.1 alpha/beta hydrolase [Alphaproteobacteria bacterium]MDP6813148.1 alpha/beta hydrolase [Alphaproteobacteria bacterium]
MSKEYVVRGGGGVGLWTGEWGRPDGPPILFIHGFMQSHLSWRAQLDGPLAEQFRLVAIDNRGHGRSDKPLEAAAYDDGGQWADDIAAVIETLGLHRPILAGWSYGGYIMLDYFKRYGTTDVAGVNFVAAGVKRATDSALSSPTIAEIGPGLLAEDLPRRIQAVRDFLAACTEDPVDRDCFETWLAFNMLVPPRVCQAMLGRQLDFDDVLAALDIPALVSHGDRDRLVLPAMAEHSLSLLPRGRASIYPGIGHAPFHEAADRFNAELAAFAGEIAD